MLGIDGQDIILLDVTVSLSTNYVDDGFDETDEEHLWVCRVHTGIQYSVSD
jgi:hypothetical protein